ncbi:restriction endonuclease subunit S [Listeria booriae]|uniref:Restriction endonuclease subunit S n=1 Tax=Listeria booriae TaxID=1552123 RepID=A0A842ETS2_9LIST|nr:restriction endonuclease subunit S [Listeria booriae]MBC2240034.1 restriction endonuclease subunit S [Listeria booriae]
MSDKKRNVPVLRFNGFSDAWEQRKLGELGKVTTGKAFSSIDFDEQGEYLVITNKDISTSSRSQNVVTDRINVSDKNIIEKYNLNGENILVTMDGVNLGKTAMYSNENALLAQRVGRIQSTQLEFVYQITSSNNFFMTMRTLSVGNAIKHISLSQISNYSTLVPNNEAEQQKIGELFKHLDNTIALHQRKLDTLKQMKKGFLQQLFPKNGEKVPRMRFTGFQEEWEQRKFGEMVNRLNKTSNSSGLPKVEFEDIISGAGRLNKDISNKFDNRKGVIFHPNNILYGKLRPYLKNWLHPNFKGVALGDFWVFEASDTHPFFIYILIQSENYQKVANDTAGTKMPRSDWKKVSNTNFLIPTEKYEQQKIGSFFKQLDNTITLHQYKLDQLNILKRSCLQNMFI